MPNCEQGNLFLSQAHGKAWEHFRLGNDYVFSNQIPNRQSWTRTHPGWILFDQGYCQWQGEPPPRPVEAEEATTVTTVPAPRPDVPPVAMDLPGEGMQSGGFGVLVLLAAVAAGGWYWVNRNKAVDPNYHPHADLEIELPALVGPVAAGEEAPAVLELAAGQPIPPGYEVVEDEDEYWGDEDNTAGGGGIDDTPKFEPSPWLPDALKQQIDAQVRAQSSKLFLQGMSAAEHRSPEPLGNRAGKPLERPGNLLENSAERPGNQGGNFRKFVILPDGSAQVAEPLRAKEDCFRLLRAGEANIQSLVYGVFGVKPGRSYKPLSTWVKNWKAQWEEISHG